MTEPSNDTGIDPANQDLLWSRKSTAKIAASATRWQSSLR